MNTVPGSATHAAGRPSWSRSARWAATAVAVGGLMPIDGFAQVAPTYLSTPGAGWKYSASIYAYVPAVDGSTSFPADSAGTSLNLTADQILDKLEFFGMGTFGANNGTWGVFTDVIYLKFGGSRSASRDFTIGAIGLPADASASFDWGLKGWAWTLAGDYRLVSQPSLTVDFLAGMRWLDIRQRLSWTLAGSIGPLDPASRSGTVEVSHTALDAIIGVKGRYAFGAQREWGLPFYVDVGAGESSSTVQAAAGLSYAFTWGEVTAMWRYLGYHAKSDRGLQDINFNGPLIGATFRW